MAAGGAVAAYAATAQRSTPPIARYEMKAGTISGMGAMGGPGGGAGGKRPGAGAAMSMMFGGGRNSARHELDLELGSSLAPTGGAPRADHFIPAGMKLGASLALKTPVHTAGTSAPDQFQRPRMRMLIFWGCGEHAPKGQPVVIDFSKLGAGSVPPGLFSSSVPVDNWVNEASSRTYGRWPSDDGKYAKPDSMLPGAHRVVANYAPEMDFTLSHDFMAALRASSATQAGGSTLLNWSLVPDATGYYAWVMGGKGDGQQMQDVVWWTSSASREFGGGLSDWLSPATVARLVANRTVLSPQTTNCTVPAEVRQAAPNFMYAMIYAYGPEESFAYPPRPASPNVVWHPQWEARIRYRSMTGMMLGMPGMGGMGGMADSGDEGAPPPKCQPKKKKKGLGALGGMLGGVITGQLPSDDGCR
ncbi:MAG: hypothetical protein KGL48_08365 [Sphingomonadales bacterium]|nr:hypothetical protein [Sphingomonadales bacterium]MDE2568894.1 hypothetical protein [Sphingomonadales bacterium]